MITGIVAALALVFLGGKFLLGDRSGPELDGPRLDMRQAVENANSLRGNEYVVQGTVDGRLDWDADRGEVISLKVDDGSGPRFLGIEIPAGLSTINIEREQDYAFRVRFRDNGVAVAENVTRL